ncbi:MAG: hypothetical protein IKL52_07500 [Candidatus Gastranaerophilales bacterium]|nr:hypothetical protein [Candidatus Gastranaerophilales bacterium]
MKKKLNIDLTTQNKLIIAALLFSTCLIVFIAIMAVKKISDELDDSYRSFGQLLTKTLAVQNYEITQTQTNPTALSFVKAHVNSILSSTNDISYIIFKDKLGDVIYSTTETYSKRSKNADTNISSPILDPNSKVVGSVEVGLSANLAKGVTNATKNSIFLVFSAVWLVFTLVILVNAYLIRRELTRLHHGVKEIEQGKFGTVLDYNQASGEIKELFDAFNDMSKKLHSYEEQNIDQLTVERNKLEAVLMSIANGVVVCDNYDKISIINSAAQKILNSSQLDILNTSIQDYCDTTGELCFKEKIAVFKNTPLDVIEKKPLEFNINVDKRIIKSIISPMYSKMHDYLGYIIVLIDITKEAEVDKLKNDFISNVSHELRTPVTILSSYADTLYNYGNEFNYDEQKEFIGTINQEVIRLNKMVNDILDFSRLQSDRTLEKEKQDITQTIDKIAQSHKVLADEKNISITFIKEDNLPTLSYNSQSIERVMSNLITNAIKYSPNNSRVKIRAEIARDPKYLEVTVEDNGMGIAPEHQKMIFERFFRIENQVHTVKGTGLGLHLVKVAIEKHHQGQIFVKSKLNEGSTFGFWLPLDEADVKDVSLKDLKDKTYNENKGTYSQYKIEKIEDYNKKSEFDAKYIGQTEPTKQNTSKEDELEAPMNLVFEEINSTNANNPIRPTTLIHEATKEDEWEITFEVRDN